MLQWNDELKIIPEAVKITKQKIWSLVMIQVMIYNKWFVGNCNDTYSCLRTFWLLTAVIKECSPSLEKICYFIIHWQRGSLVNFWTLLEIIFLQLFRQFPMQYPGMLLGMPKLWCVWWVKVGAHKK
jgi:hypothetical protein